MASELKVLIQHARRNGWTVQQSKRNGHWVFYDTDGRRVATAGSTLSDYRAIRNIKAHLRRAGLRIPRKGERK